MITVAGHTFDPKYLTPYGVIIDVGARGFEFANHFPSAKMIYCIDPDQEVFAEREKVNHGHYFPNQVHMNVAIFNKAGVAAIYRNGEGTVLQQLDPDQNHPFIPCKTITMDELYAITGTNVDILKLDCEGAEYMILSDDFKPIPKQISVEFHRHTVPDLHDKHIDRIFTMLSKHYEAVHMPFDERHGSGFNYWDCLFIRKDLL